MVNSEGKIKTSHDAYANHATTDTTLNGIQ